MRSNSIKDKTVGSKEIIQLKNTKNGYYALIEQKNRNTFEVIYKFISDNYNQDLEIGIDTELESSLQIVADYFQDYWLVKELF